MRKLINTLLIIAVSVLAVSCMKDLTKHDSPGNLAEDGVKVTFRYGSNQLSSSTRALTFAQENEIEDINVLVFDNNDELVDILEGKNVVVTTGDPLLDPKYSAEGTFSVIIRPSASATDTYNLVVLANAETALMTAYGSLDVDDVTDKDYEDVIEALFVAVNSKLYPSGGIIPMWGESGQIEVKTGTTIDPLELTRAIARIDVGVGQASYDAVANQWEWDGEDASGEVIPFRLGSVYVIKPNDRFVIIPDVAELTAGNPTILTGTNAISMANSKSNFKFDAIAGVTSGSGGYLTQNIYVPEADILMGATGKSGDANHSNRMAIIVGGYYDDSTTETFYRLDFVKDGDLMNVLRNHLYRFDITAVYGEGYPTVETAYDANSFNMDFDIVDWDSNDMQILFDGTYYVSLQNSRNENLADRTAVVYRNAGSTDWIVFDTNVPETFALDLDGGDFPDPNDLTVIENNKFRVEIKTNINGDECFFFTALAPYGFTYDGDDIDGEPIYVAMPEPVLPEDNTSELLVTAAGRIKFKITIIQRPGGVEDWKKGNDQEISW